MEKQVAGYAVGTLSYRDVKPLMKAQSAGELEHDFQDELAGIAVRRDGVPIGVVAFLDLPFPIAQKLLLAVAETNAIESDADEGNG